MYDTVELNLSNQLRKISADPKLVLSWLWQKASISDSADRRMLIEAIDLIETLGVLLDVDDTHCFEAPNRMMAFD